MNTEQLKTQLVILKEREKKLSEILKDASFKTEEEAQQFINNNRADLEELKTVRQQIRDIEWSLMSEEERQEKIKFQQAIKEKYKDEYGPDHSGNS